MNLYKIRIIVVVVGLNLLHVVQLLVIAVYLEQLVVGTPLYDTALVEHADFVAALDGRESVGYGDGGAGLHESLQRLLDQSLALGVERRGGLVEDEYGRVLEYGAGYADALSLSAAESSAAVADVGIEAVLRLGDELIGIGYACGALYLFLGGVAHAEGDVVVERVVEEDGLLVDIADELSQVVYAQVLDIDAVDEHLALLHIVVTGDEVEQGRLARAALSHDRDGLALGYDEVDVAQHPLLVVAEGHVAELNLVLQPADVYGVLLLADVYFGIEYPVDALHAGQALGDVVAGARELLERVDDGVEDDEVVDECGARHDVAAQHHDAAKPQHDDYHECAQELAHGVGGLLAHLHAGEVVTIAGVGAVETLVHLLLGAEGLDDAQSAEGLLDLAHGVAP